ncbi:MULTISPECIES: protein-glutamate O-methyltransferase CheR [unclassified Methanosarcina]|uniref:CheR family methyltransferase n=1 Tax=unclassified Methanosarcina TaxID=2644672 RepID=UPI000615658F|nr:MULTISPECIES: protein-glutamate O-methyltransferase CheR [unclassified Methanosarcina]AKB20261.1 Chemotaxis protein methyltransferase CheR [Methanosarcina sp. WWM596]AKB23460.1 Chemotaxis protein methyltransferase CheR [Methanosarcina sp. WH1]
MRKEGVKGSKNGIKTGRETVKINKGRIQIGEDKIKASKNLEEDPGFELLKRVITESTGFNCEQYKEAHFRRRINIRVRATNSKSYEEYLKLLKKNSGEHEDLITALTINVSEFFRNPETFGVIEKEVIPFLIKSRSDSLVKSIRIWSAGCATGEEAYSLAILLHRVLGRDFDRYRISITGTDIDNLSLENARKGIYRENVLKNVDASIRKSYFVKKGETYQVSEQLKSMIRFKRHDMISESSTNRFDLIICRNAMIYFKKEIQEQLQLNFYHALNRGGFFVIGKAETLLGTASNRFKPYNARERLYIKET